MLNARQDMILQLIETHEVSTQEMLRDLLEENGFSVTQATVSRDIRELKLVKMTTGRGSYRDSLPRSADHLHGVKFSAALTDSIVSVRNAQNLVVVKTYPGLANAVAVGIDHMNLSQVLGCVAGDDTILIVMQDEAVATVFVDKLRELLRNI